MKRLMKFVPMFRHGSFFINRPNSYAFLPPLHHSVALLCRET